MNAENTLKASIIIPTYNGADTLQACLQQLFAQETPWHFDVHIVDSGSTDGTVELVKKFPVHLTQIPNSEFSHGGTRNRAASQVTGEYVVFLVQDAEPMSVDWLRTLVTAVETHDAAGAFGGQDPHPEAGMYSSWLMARVLPRDEKPVVKRLASPKEWDRISPQQRYKLAFFHNANSCIRRDVLRQIPFRVMPYGEDMDWARRALLSGHTIVYEPKARVIHSHDRSVSYTFKRAYSDHSLVGELFDMELIRSPLGLFRGLAWNVVASSRWILARDVPLLAKIGGVIETINHSTAQLLGTFVGSRSDSWMSKSSLMVRLDRKLRRGV